MCRYHPSSSLSILWFVTLTCTLLHTKTTFDEMQLKDLHIGLNVKFTESFFFERIIQSLQFWPSWSLIIPFRDWGKYDSSSKTLNSGTNWPYSVPSDLKIWRMALKNIKTPFLCYFKLCALFRSRWFIQTGVTLRKRRNRSISVISLVPYDLEIWQMTLKNNGTPLQYCIKHSASLHCHMWIQDGVTVRKWLNWLLIFVTLPF